MLFKTQTFARTWQVVQSKLELLHRKGKIQDHPGIQGQGITRQVQPLAFQLDVIISET